MPRALVVLGVLVPALPAAARAPNTFSALQPVQDLSAPTLMMARLGASLDFEIIPQSVVDELVRWRVSVRDMMNAASDHLAELAQNVGLNVPDVSVLTWEPLPQSKYTWATSSFGWRDDPIRHRRKFHSGADIRSRPGTPVMAAGDGIVTFTGRQGGYGNVIYVDHGGGVVTRYAHLRQIEATKDSVITAGTRIGQVGSTGRATGPHLHFEVRIDGKAVSPTTALAIGELQRESPNEGNLAAYALTPELQALEMSDLDPPKTRTAKRGKSSQSRPERAGRTKRVRPTS
ncbi:MAG: M23 family metallopeptidase [Deltaproteobacteria bacterium]|nr:M23 family metallopeptidase [Deltaproteobacteria bacterium]